MANHRLIVLRLFVLSLLLALPMLGGRTRIQPLLLGLGGCSKPASSAGTYAPGALASHWTPTPAPSPTATPVATPTVTTTPTPNPCAFPYGIDVLGRVDGKEAGAFESPLDLSRPATIQAIHCYSSRAETVTAGLYDSTNTLVRSARLVSRGAGWYTADFPVTLGPTRYYLGRFGTDGGPRLSDEAGIGCSFADTGNLPERFIPTGSYVTLGLPVYLTGCRPLTLSGNLIGIGDSIQEGVGASSIESSYFRRFGSWLAAQYGPVTAVNLAISGVNSKCVSVNIDVQMKGREVALCVLEGGAKNFENPGQPGISDCGGVSRAVGYTNALIYGNDMRHAIDVVKRHLLPGGMVLVMNNYENDEFIELVRPGWDDYPAILRAYNRALAKVAADTGVRLVDVYTLFKDHPSYRKMPDLHPSDAGHAAIAELLKECVEAPGPSAPAASPNGPLAPIPTPAPSAQR